MGYSDGWGGRGGNRGLVQAEKVRDAVLDPLGDGLPLGGRARLLRAGRTVRQIVLGPHAEVTLDRAATHGTRVQFAEARRADARVPARQQGAGQRVELADDAQLLLSRAGQADQSATATVRQRFGEGPLRGVVAGRVVVIAERVAGGQIQLLQQKDEGIQIQDSEKQNRRGTQLNRKSIL